MQLQPFHKILILTLVFLNVTFMLQAQSVKELESQRKQTLKKLETTNQLLNENKKSKVSTLNKLNILTKNIKQRKTLIKTINIEINQLDVEMNKLEIEKRNLEKRLKTLKIDYAKLVQEAHINRNSYTKIMFVMSAKSFDQSYRRLRYLEEYTDYRKQQVREIEKVTADIVQKNENLQEHKTTKVEVVTQKETEAKKLTKDEQSQKVMLTSLQKKEKRLRADLKVQQKKARDLNNKIERIIAEEIRKAEAKRAAEEEKRLAAERKGKSDKSTSGKNSTSIAKSSTSKTSTLTKEETLLSGNFERNIGRLPWPTSKGFINGHYGIHEHPVLKHVTTNNKGIYIQTPTGSSARAVFDGVVTQRFAIPGSNNAVIVQHGNYRTVYANLTQIYVREGDHVKAKQDIGKIYTDDEKEDKTELYFQIWNGKNIQNPEKWISK